MPKASAWRRLGSRQRRSRRRAVPRLRRRRRHARAGTTPHHVAGRQHVEGGDRSGHADAGCCASAPRRRRTQAPPAWQGSSAASWEFAGGRRGRGQGGDLKVVTTRMRPGYLQKNGVPYGANAVLTEYFARTIEPQRRLLADSHGHRRGSPVSDRPLRAQHALQAAARQQLDVGTGAVLDAMMTRDS